MDKNAAKRWRPIIENLLDNLTRQEAVESILLLLEAPGQKVVLVPSPAPSPDPPRRLRAVPGGRTDHDADPPDESEKEPLDPLAYFTVEEAAAYVGIGRDRMYQLLRSDPERFPHKREVGARGREEYRISGRGLNAYRWERTKGKGAAMAQSE